MGWFATRKEEKQAILKQIQNLDPELLSENNEFESVDLENIDEMNKIFENIITNEEDRERNDQTQDPIEDDLDVTVTFL